MAPKRPLIENSLESDQPPPKRLRLRLSWPRPPPSSGHSLVALLSDELLIRILHHLPLRSILLCQQVSRHWARLAADSQVWKGLYYGRFVRPRALRIPNTNGLKETGMEWAFSSRSSKWLDEGEESRREGVDWKRRYRLRHNWRKGVATVRRIGDGAEDQNMEAALPEEAEEEEEERQGTGLLVRLVEGVIITVSSTSGLRAFDSKTGHRLAYSMLYTTDDREIAPTCLAVAPSSGAESDKEVRVVVGFADGGVGIWKLLLSEKERESQRGSFSLWYRRPGARCTEGETFQPLTAAAYTHPYLLTITSSQILSLYIFQCSADEVLDTDGSPTLLCGDPPASADISPPNPRLLASLNSSTSWPPTSISLRLSPEPSIPIIAAIAYSIPTTRGACTIGLQELHISTDGTITLSRLATSIPQGFQSLLTPATVPNNNSPARTAIPTLQTANTPTTISYSHPYLLTAHPNNTLTLYLVTSNIESLEISSGTSLHGHTSCVLGAMVGARGKAVSISRVDGGHVGRFMTGSWNGNGLHKAGVWDGDVEVRVWELEGCVTAGKNWQRRVAATGAGGSVRVIGREVLESESEEEIESGSEAEISGKAVGTAQKSLRGWVGFDDEVVVVLRGGDTSRNGADMPEPAAEDKLLVYNFT